ncbi:unnamed protein product [Microthlaspi erraticum]|uniref:Arabidopsis retrotransposon Orf1 C-terminal domain-containing protein n=1 Tax=Microthlaspi erraticum TaxID=1685480 RepID=A0A6D2JXG1_9BRAS|nr:unnamed protein product [Microthlaspi erraticum]
MWSWSQEHALGEVLLSHGIYKELTCEFFGFNEVHMYDEDRADLDQGLGWITFLAKGEKRMVTFRQLGYLFGFNYGEGPRLLRSGAQCLRYVHKALANTFFARKATGQSTRGNSSFLDMGIKPILSRTSDGKRIRGDRSDTGNLMPLLEHLHLQDHSLQH